MMAIILSLLASFFFSLTFVLNQIISTDGGDFLWSSALRFLFMIPFFWGIIYFKKKRNFSIMFKMIKRDVKNWFLWSQVGFGLFYVPLCFASTQAPGWLVASTWQITIVVGSIIAPLLESDPIMKKSSYITKGEAFLFIIIIVGIIIIELQHISSQNVTSMLTAACAVLIAAVAYPLGNRKIMLINQKSYQLNTEERILAMLICSLPTWITCSVIAFLRSGVPSISQVQSSLFVSLLSGVIATYLFFLATQLVCKNFKKLATVEAIQSLEVLFSVILGVLFLNDDFPNFITIGGLLLIISGVFLKVMRS